MAESLTCRIFAGLAHGPASVATLVPDAGCIHRALAATRLERAGVIERAGREPSAVGRGRARIVWQQVPGAEYPKPRRRPERRAAYRSRQEAVLAALAEGPLSSCELRQIIGRPLNHTNSILSRLRNKGRVHIVGHAERKSERGMTPYLWALREERA